MPYGVKDFVAEVGGFWYKQARAYISTPSPTQQLSHRLTTAQKFNDWESAALSLDLLLSTDLWRRSPTSPHFDARLIQDRLDALTLALSTSNTAHIISLFRSGLVRNLGNITSPALYDVAYAGTKILIDQYIRSMCLAVEYVTALPPIGTRERGGLDDRGAGGGMTAQEKMDLMHDARQAYGRTALLLQGGAVYGLSHLGVVKALHLRGLLPRIIIGHGVGAIMAALVCVHREEELLPFLEGRTEILGSFSHSGSDSASNPNPDSADPSSTHHPPYTGSNSLYSTLSTLLSILSPSSSSSSSSFSSSTHSKSLTLTHLSSLLTHHLHNLTFNEAYQSTKRVLNISLSTPLASGSPTLLNHITARDVVIRTAALASNTSPYPGSSGSDNPVILLAKLSSGELVPWKTDPRTLEPLGSQRYEPRLAASFSGGTHENSTKTGTGSAGSSGGGGGGSGTGSGTISDSSPLQRAAQLFNVNHFLISQPRPYLASFLRSLSTRTHRPYISSSSSFSSQRTSSSLRVLNPFRLFTLPVRAVRRLSRPLLAMLAVETQHRLVQLDSFGLLPSLARRVLLEEVVPGSSFVVELGLEVGDWVRGFGGSFAGNINGQLVEEEKRGEGIGSEGGGGGGRGDGDRNGEGELIAREEEWKRELQYWIRKGERAVWPAVAAIKVRCAVEVELERGYQMVRIRRGQEGIGGFDGQGPEVRMGEGSRGAYGQDKGKGKGLRRNGIGIGERAAVNGEDGGGMGAGRSFGEGQRDLSVYGEGESARGDVAGEQEGLSGVRARRIEEEEDDDDTITRRRRRRRTASGSARVGGRLERLEALGSRRGGE